MHLSYKYAKLRCIDIHVSAHKKNDCSVQEIKDRKCTSNWFFLKMKIFFLIIEKISKKIKINENYVLHLLN